MKRWIPILVFVGLLIASCKEKQSSSDTPGPAPAYQFKKEGVLAFYTAAGEKIKTIDIEVAATDEERHRA